MSLNNSQYNEIMKVYGERQLQNYHDQKARIEKAYAAIPELKVLDERVSGVSLEAAEALVRGDRSLKEALPETIAALTSKKRELLRAHGLPADELDPRYQCLDCHDTGFTPDGRKCHCFRALETKLLYRQSNVSDIVERENFSVFDLSRFDDTRQLSETGGRTNRVYMQTVENYLKKYCVNFDQEHKSVILMGKPGTGKTFLVNCVTKELLDSGHSVIYLSSTDFFEALSTRRPEEDEMADHILESDLLVIDDLGTELSNSFTVSRLFYVVNHRLVTNKPVIISTNLNFQSMNETYSERVVSRIMAGYEIIPLYGQDQRL